ncbi:MAG TPA: BatD family protein [Candidatus Binatia bacterium]|nr:BatD family protein [Candidatus Binatia bacterium]
MKRLAAGAILAGAWLAVAAPAALAQEINVRARVDRSRVGEGGQVILTVEVSGPTLGDIAPPDVSGIVDFDIVGGPMPSSRFQWINGRTSATKTWAYALRPRQTGSRTIPALGLLVGGRTYRTQSIDLDVVPGGTGASPTPGGVPPGVRGGPGRAGGNPRAPGEPEAAPGRVLVAADVDSRTAYVGQQVTLRVLLDTQTEILNLGSKDSPTFPGFWAEEIKLPENLELRRIQKGSEAFNEYTLMKRALFPTGSGPLSIPSMTYQVQVRRRSQDPIESFFFTPTETLTRRTEPITVQVQPLPAASRPDDFTGAVGAFTLTVTADRSESRVNDAIGLKVRVAGEGNLNAVNALPLPELSDFKQFAPKVTTSTSVVSDRLRSEKVWDYVLIPLAPGTQTIPPVRFSFFDPRAGAYRSVASAPVPIQVAKGGEGSGSAGPIVSQSDVRQLRRDIHFIKQATDGLKDWSRPFYRTPLFLALLFLPVAADLGVFVVARTRDAQRATAGLRRRRRARPLALKRLKEARRRGSPSTARAFYAEVASALSDYVAAKFDIPAAGLTHDRIEELLVGRGVPEDARRAFHRCLEACDYARFAPSSSGAEEMRRTLVAAEESVTKLEKSLGA